MWNPGSHLFVVFRPPPASTFVDLHFAPYVSRTHVTATPDFSFAEKLSFLHRGRLTFGELPLVRTHTHTHERTNTETTIILV